jgi:xylose isomerase
MTHKWSTNLIPFGPTADRFNPGGYRQDSDIETKISLASQIEGLDGVELHFPDMFKGTSPEAVAGVLESHNLECSIVSPTLSGDRLWENGSLSNPDDGIRKQAIQRVKEAMDASVTLGAKRLNIWMGQDGFDYPFQVDYGRQWRNLVDSLRECAAHNPEVRLCVEPKLKQPRTHSLLGTTAKVLLLLHDVDMDNAGCLFDTGHAFFAWENLAEQVVLLGEYGKLFHLHFNDNYGDWDWDMTVGSVHYIEFVELLYWLRRIGYDGWFSLDQFPQREDPVRALSASIRAVKRMEELLDRVDAGELGQKISEHDPLAVFELIESARAA